jgi:hypothetical protein
MLTLFTKLLLESFNVAVPDPEKTPVVASVNDPVTGISKEGQVTGIVPSMVVGEPEAGVRVNVYRTEYPSPDKSPPFTLSVYCVQVRSVMTAVSM